MTYHMRRHDRAITDPAMIDSILSEARYVTIALSGDDGPYIFTLSCGFDDQRRRLCFHVAHEGRKLDLIRRDPRAAATVVQDLGYKHGECAHPYRSVVMRGRMRLAGDADEAREGMRTLLAQLEGDSDEAWAAMGLDDETRMSSFSVLFFEIDDVTAKEGE